MADAVSRVLLVIGDGEIAHGRVRDYFEDIGFEVISTQEPRDCVELLAGARPEAVLIDFDSQPPEAWGSLMRCTSLTPWTPVLMFSSQDSIEHAARAFRAGAWDYLVKPVDDMTVLKSATEKAFLRARLLQESLRIAGAERPEDGRAGGGPLSAGTGGVLQGARIPDTIDALYKTIFESSYEAITVVDSHTRRFVRVNPAACALFGYAPDEFTSLQVDDIHPRDCLEQALFDFQEHARGRKTETRNVPCVRKDGSFMYVDICGNPCVLEGRECSIGFFRDVTDRRRDEEEAAIRRLQLVQADRLTSLGTLVAGVAHEINNPNHHVMLSVSLLERMWDGIRAVLDEYHEREGDFFVGGMSYSEARDNVPQLLRDVMGGAERIGAIVQALRDFALEEPSPLTDDVNVNEVLESSQVLLSNMLKKSTNTFVVEMDEDCPSFRGNFRQIEQVVINLIQNACQALPSQDRGIRVCTRYDAEASTVILEVIDEGTGISEKDLPRITNPFFTTKRASGGSGLGLSVSSRIVQDHGGTLAFTSTSGEGTTARISIPLVDRNAGAQGQGIQEQQE